MNILSGLNNFIYIYVQSPPTNVNALQERENLNSYCYTKFVRILLLVNVLMLKFRVSGFDTIRKH